MSRSGQYKGEAPADAIMHIRIPTYQKEMIRASAEKRGVSLSEFVIAQAYRAAKRIVEHPVEKDKRS